jgi:hypothetical protein
MNLHVYNNALFAFCNKNRSQIKVLYWGSASLRFGRSVDKKPNSSKKKRRKITMTGTVGIQPITKPLNKAMGNRYF